MPQELEKIGRYNSIESMYDFMYSTPSVDQRW